MRLLLHTCCATCGSYVAKLLQNDFSVDVFFYNPNIYPREEHERRLTDVKKFCDAYDIKLIEGEYNHQSWLDYIKGFEASPEQGERCFRCYEFRLRKTAEYAKNNSYDFFTTTLSVSPHKKVDIINKLGIDLAVEANVNPVRDSAKLMFFEKYGGEAALRLPFNYHYVQSQISNGVKFYEADFKKKDGFKKSIERAKEFDFYRQNYCGCEFSNPRGKQ